MKSRFDELPQRLFRCVVSVSANRCFSFSHASSEAPLCSMSGWVCRWKSFWIPVEDSFKKAYMEKWVFISDVPSEGPSSTDQGEVIPETPRVSKHSTSSPWEPAKPHDKACFWERIEAPLPPLRPRPKCDFNIHVRSVPFLSVWYCRFQLR